ncbi:MAG TPA: hypothetical protein VKV16_09930, partial [Solirubrobacteraceae bacterium]|nr:hypothetical protein [Solirubrobacteraceae bacterium]
GVVLGPTLLSRSLPSVAGSGEPARGGRVRGASLRAELSVLGGAPAALLGYVERVYNGSKGITAAMRNGLLVYFGDAALAHAKWLSLARVLADPSSAGASYVDVRVPSHPAAGFPAGVTPPDAAASAAGASSAADGAESPVASLAAGLPGGSEATGGGEATDAEATGGSEATGAGGETAAGSGGEATAGAPDGSSASGAGAAPQAAGEAAAPSAEAGADVSSGADGASPSEP